MEVCSARLNPLQLWASSRQMNIARRRLYDDLEAQLGQTGLMLGEAHFHSLPWRQNVETWVYWLAHLAPWAPQLSCHSVWSSTSLAMRMTAQEEQKSMEHWGLLVRAGREQTQGLDARSLFRERDGRVEPALQPLQTPVRAIVLHIGDASAARALSAAVERHLSPLAQDAGLWLQDPSKFHATLFHASAHEVRAEFGMSLFLQTINKFSLSICWEYKVPIGAAACPP